MDISSQALVAPAGVIVSLDTTGNYPSVVVSISESVPALDDRFMQACHAFAGDEGASIEFCVVDGIKSCRILPHLGKIMMRKINGRWHWGHAQ